MSYLELAKQALGKIASPQMAPPSERRGYDINDINDQRSALADLPPDLFETWEERAAIREFDGMIPREQAEALALADVLGQADPPPARETLTPRW